MYVIITPYEIKPSLKDMYVRTYLENADVSTKLHYILSEMSSTYFFKVL